MCGQGDVCISDSQDPIPDRITRVRFESRVPGTSQWDRRRDGYHSVFKATGAVHFVSRTLDKRADMYHEWIVDRASGVVVRDVSEPLTTHSGHGSAKRSS